MRLGQSHCGTYLSPHTDKWAKWPIYRCWDNSIHLAHWWIKIQDLYPLSLGHLRYMGPWDENMRIDASDASILFAPPMGTYYSPSTRLWDNLVHLIISMQYRLLWGIDAFHASMQGIYTAHAIYTRSFASCEWYGHLFYLPHHRCIIRWICAHEIYLLNATHGPLCWAHVI